MKKSIIAVLLSAVITPAAFADSFSVELDQSGNIVQGVRNPVQGIFDVKPTAGKVTLFGTENTVANLDQIQNNLNLIQDHQSQITVNRITIDTNAKNIAQNKIAIDDNTHEIDTNAQQLRATAKQVGDNRDGVAANKVGIKTNADAIARNKTAIDDNTHEIDTNAQLIRSTEKQVGENRTVLMANKGDIVTLTQDTKVAQTTGEYAQFRAQTAMQNAEKNRAALVASNKKIAANSVALADHEQRIETLEQSNSSNFGKLKNEVEHNRKRASAGIAGVAAMANIPQVTNTQNFSVGAGVGNTDGENALAVGFSARATENVVVKASVSNDTQHNFVAGGGIAYGW